MYFIEGEYHDQYCPWCQQMHPARLFLNRFRWCCILDKHCGREKVLGYTMPQDVLMQMGLASGNDSSIEPNVQNAVDIVEQERMLEEKWNLENYNSGRTRSKFL